MSKSHKSVDYSSKLAQIEEGLAILKQSLLLDKDSGKVHSIDLHEKKVIDYDPSDKYATGAGWYYKNQVARKKLSLPQFCKEYVTSKGLRYTEMSPSKQLAIWRQFWMTRMICSAYGFKVAGVHDTLTGNLSEERS